MSLQAAPSETSMNHSSRQAGSRDGKIEVSFEQPCRALGFPVANDSWKLQGVICSLFSVQLDTVEFRASFYNSICSDLGLRCTFDRFTFEYVHAFMENAGAFLTPSRVATWQARQGRLIIVCTEGDSVKMCASGKAKVIEVPHIADCLQTVVNIVPLQVRAPSAFLGLPRIWLTTDRDVEIFEIRRGLLKAIAYRFFYPPESGETRGEVYPKHFAIRGRPI